MEDSLGVQLVDHTAHSSSSDASPSPSPSPSPSDHATVTSSSSSSSSALVDRLPCIDGLADRVRILVYYCSSFLFLL
jgi:hypothetical protein